MAILKSTSSANQFIKSSVLKSLNYSVFIPSYLVSRTGVVKNIPIEHSEIFLKENISSSAKIIEAARLNRKITKEGKSQIVPSSSVRLTFEGRVLPSHVSLFYTSLSVSPFIPRTNLCFNCLRTGHISKACKSAPRCLYCGKGRHADTEICSDKDNSPRCINCNGPHYATSAQCPRIEFQKRVVSLAATENIPVFEARHKLTSLTSNSSERPSTTSSKYDFSNFPLLSSSNKYASSDNNMNRFYSHNIYSALDSETDLPAQQHSKTYAQATASDANHSRSAGHRQIHLINRPCHSFSSPDGADTAKPPLHSHYKNTGHRGTWSPQHWDELMYPNGHMDFRNTDNISSVGHWNCRGLRDKMLLGHMDFESFDVLCVQETFLREHSSLLCRGFAVVRRNMASAGDCGICILTSSTKDFNCSVGKNLRTTEHIP